MSNLEVVEYGKEDGKLVAIEIYSDGSTRKVFIKNGIVDYIINGESLSNRIDKILTPEKRKMISEKIDKILKEDNKKSSPNLPIKHNKDLGSY